MVRKGINNEDYFVFLKKFAYYLIFLNYKSFFLFSIKSLIAS
jgi:hypothetical protein